MANRMRVYRCKNAHEYSDVVPWEVKLKYAADGVVSSGPLCPYCQLEWMKENFGTVEIEHVAMVKSVTVPFWPSEPENPKPKRRRKEANG